MVTDIQYKGESQLLHYYQWWRAENLVNLSVVQANAHVYVVVLAFKYKLGELYGTYKPNEKYFLTLVWKTWKKNHFPSAASWII